MYSCPHTKRPRQMSTLQSNILAPNPMPKKYEVVMQKFKHLVKQNRDTVCLYRKMPHQLTDEMCKIIYFFPVWFALCLCSGATGLQDLLSDSKESLFVLKYRRFLSSNVVFFSFPSQSIVMRGRKWNAQKLFLGEELPPFLSALGPVSRLLAIGPLEGHRLIPQTRWIARLLSLWF